MIKVFKINNNSEIEYCWIFNRQNMFYFLLKEQHMVATINSLCDFLATVSKSLANIFVSLNNTDTDTDTDNSLF